MEWPAVAAVIAASGLVGGVVTKLVDYAVKTSKGESAAESVKLAHARIDAVAKDHGEFKAEVARDYATNRLVAEMRTEVVGALNRLADRIDRAFERAAKD